MGRRACRWRDEDARKAGGFSCRAVSPVTPVPRLNHCSSTCTPGRRLHVPQVVSQVNSQWRRVPSRGWVRRARAYTHFESWGRRACGTNQCPCWPHIAIAPSRRGGLGSVEGGGSVSGAPAGWVRGRKVSVFRFQMCARRVDIWTYQGTECCAHCREHRGGDELSTSTASVFAGGLMTVSRAGFAVEIE